MDSKSDATESKKFAQNYFLENMRTSYDFWHQIYKNSPVNISLIWKKAIDSNSEFIEQFQKAWEINSQKSNSDLQQFLEKWAKSIRESNFKNASESISQYFNDLSDSQTKFSIEVLKMIEGYWRNIQDKNIE